MGKRLPAGLVALVTNVAVCTVVGLAINKSKSLIPLIALPFCILGVSTSTSK